MPFRRLVLLAATAIAALAQQTPWTGPPLRGAWVRTASPAPNDVNLSNAQVVVAANEPANVRQAAEFLASDLEKITGRKPEIAATAAPGRVTIRLVTMGNGPLPAPLSAATRAQPESYRILTTRDTVWLSGGDSRGTAFAAYTLSERLGIDPLYLWTGYRPEHHDPLILKATDFTQGPPAFRYRGFFHDDEDLLPRPYDANGHPLQTGDVPLDWYKRFFETALRLRMNMVAPYTRVHRRYEVQKLASDWGLYYTSHHYDILVSNPFGLERFGLAKERGIRPEWNWFTNREGMLAFWRGGVLENRAIDVIWPVGMRGTDDRSFVFPPDVTDDLRARTFRDVIREQVSMVKSLVPKDKTPLFHFTMYSEMLPWYQRDPAAFDLPEDVMIIWPDDNDGHMRALPASPGKWKHGVYYHLAYLGGRLSKQLTHTVSPSVVAGEFEKIVKAGATEYMLVNVSELRDYVMGARMISDITWDAPAIFATPEAADRYTRWWSREYFAPAGDAATAAYDRYFALLNTPDSLWNASNLIDSLVNALSAKMDGRPYPQPDPQALTAIRGRDPQFDAALAAAAKAAVAMTPTQQRFFSTDVELGLKVASLQGKAALKLEEALRAPDAARTWARIFEARAHLEQLETEFARLEYPPFDRWYGESWIRSARSANNPHRPYNQLRALWGR